MPKRFWWEVIETMGTIVVCTIVAIMGNFELSIWILVLFIFVDIRMIMIRNKYGTRKNPKNSGATQDRG